MASFLENLINNAAKSVNEGIKNRIEDGTFNRMAEGVGSGVSSMAAGLSALVGMANQAFGKLKDKVDEAREPKVSQAVDMPQTEERFDPQPAEDADPDYKPGVEPIDDLMARIANYYELDDDDITLYGMARLYAVTVVFFACCDGQYTKRERDCVEGFKQMIYETVGGYEVEGCEGDVLDYLFTEMEGYTLDDIIAMTHRLLNGMKPEEHAGVIEGLDDHIRRVIESEPRDTTVEEDNYEIWRKEFIG